MDVEMTSAYALVSRAKWALSSSLASVR